MDSAAEFKAALKDIVARYKRDYANEFAIFLDGMVALRALMEDPEYGQSQGDMRALCEIPETLENMIINGLSVDGLRWYKDKKGGLWFAKTFKEFSLIRRV